MALATLWTQLHKIREALAGRRAARSPVLERLRQDPARLMADGGMRPDPWQARATLPFAEDVTPLFAPGG